MAKTERLELRVEPELKARLYAECDRSGLKVTTFVERAVESALEDGGAAGDVPRATGAVDQPPAQTRPPEEDSKDWRTRTEGWTPAPNRADAFRRAKGKP